jgi:hypothetical protein
VSMSDRFTLRSKIFIIVAVTLVSAVSRERVFSVMNMKKN